MLLLYSSIYSYPFDLHNDPSFGDIFSTLLLQFFVLPLQTFSLNFSATSLWFDPRYAVSKLMLTLFCFVDELLLDYRKRWLRFKTTYLYTAQVTIISC